MDLFELKTPKYWEKMSIPRELNTKRKASRFSKLKRYPIKVYRPKHKDVDSVDNIIKKIDNMLDGEKIKNAE